MDALLQCIPLWDDLSHEERERWLKAAKESPELVAAAKDWKAFSKRLQAHLNTYLPDNEVLVLHALALEAPQSLTPEEQEKLALNKENLEVAFREIGALPMMVERIRTQIVDFESEWATQTLPAVRTSVEQPSKPIQPPQNWFARYPMMTWLGGVTLTVCVVMIGLWAVFNFLDTAPLVNPKSYTTVLPDPFNVETILNDGEEARTIELPDGSEATLFPHARLQYTRNNFKRRVRASGKFFFDIKKQKEVFYIESGNALTSVVGTSFALNSTSNQTEVILLQGEVMLASRYNESKAVRLFHGEMSRVIDAQEPTTPELTDLGASLTWTKKFYFRGTALKNAMIQLEKAYGVNIKIPENTTLRTIEGTFDRSEKVADILTKIGLVLQLDVHQKSDRTFELNSL